MIFTYRALFWPEVASLWGPSTLLIMSASLLIDSLLINISLLMCVHTNVAPLQHVSLLIGWCHTETPNFNLSLSLPLPSLLYLCHMRAHTLTHTLRRARGFTLQQ